MKEIGNLMHWPLLALLLLLVSGCGATTATLPSSRTNLAAAAAKASSGALAALPVSVMEGGMLRPLPEDSYLPLGKSGWEAAVRLSPSQSGLRSELTLSLVDSRTGQAVTDAHVTAAADMLYMSHGRTKHEGKALGEGRYLIPLEFEMSGDWVVEVLVERGEVQEKLHLVLNVRR